MHQIWVITDKNGKIQHCWEAPDPPDPDNPNLPTIEIPGMPANWHRFKIPEPFDFKNLKQKAKENYKSISRHIVDDYDVDLKTKKLKKKE